MREKERGERERERERERDWYTTLTTTGNDHKYILF